MPEQANTPNITGGCQCGAVRYALKSEPTGASICHCRMCQKAFGNYFAPLTGVPLQDLEMDPRTAWHLQELRGGGARLLPRLRHAADLFRYVERDRISVSIGSLDEPQRAMPETQFGASRGNCRPFVSPHPAGHANRRRCDAGRAGDLEVTAASGSGIEPSHRALFTALAHDVVDMRRHGRVGIHQLWRSSASSTRSRHAVAALTVTLRRRRWMIDASPKKSPAPMRRESRGSSTSTSPAAIRYMACASSPRRTMNSPGEQLCERRRCMTDAISIGIQIREQRHAGHHAPGDDEIRGDGSRARMRWR